MEPRTVRVYCGNMLCFFHVSYPGNKRYVPRENMYDPPKCSCCNGPMYCPEAEAEKMEAEMLTNQLLGELAIPVE
jgi:hypothetical protein